MFSLTLCLCAVYAWFLLDPVAACPEPLWLGRRAAALLAAFLSAVADAACGRSQSSFPLHVLPPSSAGRSFPLRALPLASAKPSPGPPL